MYIGIYITGIYICVLYTPSNLGLDIAIPIWEREQSCYSGSTKGAGESNKGVGGSMREHGGALREQEGARGSIRE